MAKKDNQQKSDSPSGYSLQVDTKVAKEIVEYQPKVFKQVVMKIFSLQSNPRPQDGKKLAGYEGGFRVDSGEFRILYMIDDSKKLVTVFLVGKRGDDEVYKDLKRKE